MTTRRLVVAGSLLAIVIFAAVLISQTWVGRLVAQRVPWKDREFPQVTTALDARQTAVVASLREQFARNSPGTTYSEGVEEPWCADFVSWIMRDAGVPLANPNSGSWRIPGVYTLTDYYKSEGRFRPGDSDYQPKPGDVVLYAPGWRFGQHTNFVVRVDGDTLITVGGNEGGINSGETDRDDAGIVGFGVLE